MQSLSSPREKMVCAFHYLIRKLNTSYEVEGAPDHIDDLLDDLENPTSAAKIVSSISSKEAGWLARAVREKTMRDRDRIGSDVEQEMQVSLA